MNESGQVYNYNKLRTIRTLTDIISQCIVAFAFSAFVILGLTNKPDSYIIATLLMAVPVIITYAARKNIHKNFLFMLIHAALLITAIIIGNGDAESTAYFVSVLAVCIRSVSIRVANARKTEYMNEPLYGNQFADVTQEDKKAALQAGERMSPLYCLVMVAGSLYGGSAGNRLLVNYETVLFVLFVLLAFLANQLKELNSLFISNAGKSEFPAERITGINMIMVMVVSGLMILGMILFYSGDYGNIFTLIGSSFLFSGVTAHAEEVTESFTLDPMVITATRTEMSVKESPSAVEIVSSKKLEETQAKTLRDALKSALGVNVFNDFQGRSNVSIRGSESRHVLIMVDGKRLGGELSYNSANAWDVDRIRMEDVERVEIIRGPAGALYGSDAMAGVINVITKTPEKNAGSINYEYGWYENGKGAGYKSNVYLQGVEKNVSYKLNAGLNNNRPYMDPAGSGDEMNFYGKEQPISLSVGYKFDNGNQLSADFSRIKEDNQKGSSSVTVMGPGEVWQNKKSTIYNDNKRTDYSLTYKGDDEKQSWIIRAYQSVYDKRYTSQDVTQMFTGGKPGTITVKDPKIDTVKRTLSVIEGHDSWHMGDKHYLTAGLEYRRDNSEGTRLKKKGTPVAGGSAYNAYDEAAINYTAVYVQDEFKPDEKWLIIPSVRYDYSDKFGSEITSRLATTYNAAKDIRVKAVIGQGYKTPTVNELYHFWEMYAANPGGSGQFFEGNPDLQPEKSLSYELAVEKDWGDKTTAHLGIFRNDVKDLISSYWTGRFTDDDPNSYPGLGRDQVMTYRNVPKATLQGVEFYGSHELGKNIFMNFGYTYLEAKDKTGGTRLTDRAKHQLTFGVSYQPQNIYAWDCSFDIVSNLNYYYHNADKSTMGNSVYSTKNFTIANIMASKHLTKDAKIYLGIDNISNHRNFGAYADGNLGRLYRVGMEYKF